MIDTLRYKELKYKGPVLGPSIGKACKTAQPFLYQKEQRNLPRKSAKAR